MILTEVEMMHLFYQGLFLLLNLQEKETPFLSLTPDKIFMISNKFKFFY